MAAAAVDRSSRHPGVPGQEGAGSWYPFSPIATTQLGSVNVGRFDIYTNNYRKG